MSELSQKSCKACEGGVFPLKQVEAGEMLSQLHASWFIDESTKVLSRSFSFKDYHQTIAFVNQVAMIAHQEDHHPDLEVSYSSCKVRYTTHAIGGLSENDFICAARIDRL